MKRIVPMSVEDLKTNHFVAEDAELLSCKWLEDKSINKAGGDSVHSIFCIPSTPYTFSVTFNNRFWTLSRRFNNRFSNSREDPTTDLAADATTIKDSLFRPHTPFSQPSKEDYEQNFAATRAQLSSIFERVS